MKNERNGESGRNGFWGEKKKKKVKLSGRNLLLKNKQRDGSFWIEVNTRKVKLRRKRKRSKINV